MELLQLEWMGHAVRLEGSMAGWQQLYWDDQLISQQQGLSEQGRCCHSFRLERAGQSIECELRVDFSWQPFQLDYSLWVDQQEVVNGERTAHDIEQQHPVTPPPAAKHFSIVGLLLFGFKLLKSAKAVKVALAGVSLAAYSWLFSWPFALALILCLVIHEYGHIRAMRYFGLQTKGIYLIPFLGGLALTDEKINTRWQDVVISMMGPCFGALLSLLCLVIYGITGVTFFAGIAVFNALLNLFNLLPILPLDGGHVLKSIGFSVNSLAGISLCLLGAAGGVYLSYSFGLGLLGFLILIGSLEIIFEWKNRHYSHLLPLDRYGQWFSAIWYALLVGGLIAVIAIVARSGDPVLSIPMQLLQG